MRRWYIPTRTSSWSYNTICFCLSDWTYCTTSIFLYQKLGHHFPCFFFRNDIGFPCWFFFKWFVWARTPFFAHSWWVICLRVVFSNASSQLWGRHPNFGEDIPDYNWLGGWPPSWNSVRTTTFRSNRSVQRRQVFPWVMGDFTTPGGSPVGWFRKQALCDFHAWLGDSISLVNFQRKSCTM